MGAVLEKIIGQIDKKEIRLVAGEGGMKKPVEWVHMVDNVAIADFLVGGEVAFTTGIGIGPQMSLYDLVKRIHERNASGMVINVGPYVEYIPEEILDFGNEHNFPIFEVPWEVHMANLMRIFCEAITRTKQRAMEVGAAFYNAVFIPNQEELYLSTLLQNGYLDSQRYRIAVLQFFKKERENYLPVSQARREICRKKVQYLSEWIQQDIIICTEREQLLIVSREEQKEQTGDSFGLIFSEIGRTLAENECFFLGVGNVAEGFGGLEKSYQMARQTMRLEMARGMENQLLRYEELGMYQLFLQIQDAQWLQDFYGRTIRPLKEYDALNHSNLEEVLDCYLRSDGSVQETAQKLFVHRNTINYKLRKIGDILNRDLTSFPVRCELFMGLLAEDLC